MPDNNIDNRPFRERKSLAARMEEVQGIRTKFPNKLPVIVERYHKEKTLPPLDKTKFLVPQEITMAQFVAIIRNRMQLSPSQAFYLLIDDKGIASMSLSIAEVYEKKKATMDFCICLMPAKKCLDTLRASMQNSKDNQSFNM